MHSMNNEQVIELLQSLKEMSTCISQLRRSAAIDAQHGKPTEGPAAMASAAYELDKARHNIVGHLPLDVRRFAIDNIVAAP